MTYNNESDLSRRDFLTMSWRQAESEPQETRGTPAPGSPPTDNLSFLGPLREMLDLEEGTVVPSPQRNDIYALRTRTGLLALKARCSNDGAMLAWNPDDPSEDEFDPVGRFYCSRDASIFNRWGEPMVGPARETLPVVAVTEIDGSLWADEAKPVSSDIVRRLYAEFPFNMGLYD